ncbi:MAG: hypothetical protein HY923_01105 [Elusimicrobia bacterium]|nr:hypothetical protein [Elusimicrobiota bacterium]
MKRFRLLAAAIFLQACTGEVLPDLPKHSTAVTETYFHNLGFKGMFASESTHTVSTRADMRRQTDTFKFSGFVMKHLASAHDGSTIWRIDKNKVWRLDPKAKTYQECPLAGCPRPARPERPQHAERPEPQRQKPACALSLAKNKFSVEPTGETKEINGFSTKRHKVTWEVVLQDKNKKKNTSLVSIDVWTTPENNPKLEAVRAVERNFEARVHEAAPRGEGMDKAIPPEAMKVIAMQFLADLTPDQRASVTAASSELSKIKGRPVLTHLEWNMGGEACSDAAAAKPQKAQKQGLDFTSVGGFLGSAASRGAQNKMEAMSDKPVFAFDQELKKMAIEEATDGLFVVPPSYKLVP